MCDLCAIANDGERLRTKGKEEERERAHRRRSSTDKREHARGVCWTESGVAGRVELALPRLAQISLCLRLLPITTSITIPRSCDHDPYLHCASHAQESTRRDLSRPSYLAQPLTQAAEAKRRHRSTACKVSCHSPHHERAGPLRHGKTGAARDVGNVPRLKIRAAYVSPLPRTCLPFILTHTCPPA